MGWTSSILGISLGLRSTEAKVLDYQEHTACFYLLTPSLHRGKTAGVWALKPSEQPEALKHLQARRHHCTAWPQCHNRCCGCATSTVDLGRAKAGCPPVLFFPIDPCLSGPSLGSHIYHLFSDIISALPLAAALECGHLIAAAILISPQRLPLFGAHLAFLPALTAVLRAHEPGGMCLSLVTVLSLNGLAV